MTRSARFPVAAACLLLCLCRAPSAFAGLTTLTNPSGESVVLDDATNLYWYKSPGNLAGYWSDYAEVSYYIGLLNGTSYFGVSNWHLASAAEFSAMYVAAGFDEFSAQFDPTSQVSGSERVPGNPGICFPFAGCFGQTPDQYVDYARTTWSGLLSDTDTIGRWVTIRDPDPFCVFYPSGCQDTYEYVTDPAHWVATVTFVDYEPGQSLRLDHLDASFSAARDSGYVYWDDYWERYDASAIEGAWVVGTQAGPPDVPEPSVLLLLGAGVSGLAAYRRSSKARR